MIDARDDCVCGGCPWCRPTGLYAAMIARAAAYAGLSDDDHEFSASDIGRGGPMTAAMAGVLYSSQGGEFLRH